jgi:DNA-binding protein YbaB
VRGIDVSDLGGPVSDVVQRLTEARGGGEAAEGQVRIIVDGTGDIVELKIDKGAMRLTSDELARAVRDAFKQARQAANEEMQTTLQGAGAPTVSALSGLSAEMRRLGADATQRLDDFTALAEQLSSQLGRLG